MFQFLLLHPVGTASFLMCHGMPGDSGIRLAQKDLGLEQLLVFPIALAFQAVFRDEAESSRINAVSRPAGSGPIRENMPQVGVGLLAPHLCAEHAMAPVHHLLHVIFGYWPGETGPAAA